MSVLGDVLIKTNKCSKCFSGLAVKTFPRSGNRALVSGRLHFQLENEEKYIEICLVMKLGIGYFQRMET